MIVMVALAPSSLAVLAGVAAGVGLVGVLAGLWRRPVSLKTALSSVDAGSGEERHWEDNQIFDGLALVAGGGGRLEQLAAQAFQKWRLPMSQATRARLAQQGRSIGDFFAAKLALAAAGLVVPGMLSGMAWALGLIGSPWPFGFCLIAAGLGYFWPDLSLRQSAATWRQHSADAISVYFDLVTLIRLGNASAVQALREAAELSTAPVFTQVRDALDRARLQQRPPWAELRRLSDTLGLPEVADLADIMALDEQGAALVDALRARVKELRKAHLATAKLAAQSQAEAMTVWMVVPVLVFALVFLIPPIMTMLAGM